MKRESPPLLVLRLLRFFYKEKYQEQIEGDLFELFEREPSKRKARRNFSWNCIRFFRLRYLKGIDDFEQLTTLSMIKNYFKIAIRTLLKQKSYAGINIVGLSIGIGACMLIAMYVLSENGYDRHHQDGDRLFRVMNGRGVYTPAMLAETVVEEYPQIESATMVFGLSEVHLKIGENYYMEKGGAWADQRFFEVFSENILAGNKNALQEPNSLVLTKSIADKYFEGTSAIGETIEVDGEPHKVTAVVSDPPVQTHFPYKFLVANHIDPKKEYYWTGNQGFTYVRTVNNSTKASVELQLEELYAKYVAPEMISWTGHESFEALRAEYPSRTYGFSLIPVKNIHLDYPRFSMGPRGNKQNVLIFSLIAAFVLLIACVNYINMATARSAARSKEVGIRKAMGSQRKSIMHQFLIESMVITLASVLLAFVFSLLSLNYFNDLTGRVFNFVNLFSATNLLFVIMLLLVIGILAGAYPAYVISGFSPLKALRGQMQQAGKKSLRSVLVTFQFAISIFLVAITLVIYQQVEHMQSQELGVNVDQTLIISNGVELDDNYEVFKNELLKIPGIQEVSKMNSTPFKPIGGWGYNIPDDNNREVYPANLFVVAGAEKVLDIEIISGRFFDQTRVTDTAVVVINESLAKEVGFDNPIGKVLSRGDGEDYIIAGVMKDFNFGSAKGSIRPLIFRHGNKNCEIEMYHQNKVIAKVNSKDLLKTISAIEEKWNAQVPEYPFEAEFLNDVFQRMYEGERKFGTVFTTFSILAIVIAFLGLFALTTFVLQKRFKEIAVRKVLGATVASLLRMMIKDFTPLVLIGGVVGTGVAFYWLSSWLDDYTYRIDLTWYLLALPAISILLLTWLVVTLKSYRAALANPSNALKEE